MINTVIFDMDGLMFDTEKLFIDVFEDVCHKNECSFPRELLYTMLGTSGFDCSIYEKEYPWLQSMLNKADAEFDTYFDTRFSMPGSANKYGLNELYDYLKKNNYRICIASSSSLPHIKRLVNHCGFVFDADVIVSSKNVYPSKPAPDIFLACAQSLEINANQCLVLEDSKNGIRAAYNAGMRSVWIPDQVVFNEEDMKYVDFECANLLGVIGVLEAM